MIKHVSPDVSSKAVHSFTLEQNPELVGMQAQFILQGTSQDQPIGQTYRKLQKILNWANNFSVAIDNLTSVGFHGDSQPRSYLQYTNMQIRLYILGMDFDQFLKDHPLDGRQNITRAVHTIAQMHFIPSVTRTVSNIWIDQEFIPFLLSKSPSSCVDLRAEYQRLKDSVEMGDVRMMLGGVEYTVNDTSFVGSFDEACPRICFQESSQSVCSTVPGCDWSDFDAEQNCTDDALLPERVTVSVFFPCANFESYSSHEQSAFLLDFEQQIRRQVMGIKSRTLHSFQFKKNSSDELTFVVQPTMKSHPLTHIYQHVQGLIRSGKVTAGPINTTRHIAWLDTEFTDVHVSLFYPVNFTNLYSTSTASRWLIETELRNKLEDFLPLGTSLVFDHFDMTMRENVVAFTVSRSSNSDDSDLTEMIDKLEAVVQLGGLAVSFNGSLSHADHVTSQGSFHTICGHCSNSTGTGICARALSCSDWSVPSACSSPFYLPERWTYDLFVPCNMTSSLNSSEKSEAEKSLMGKLEQVLHLASPRTVQDVEMVENGARVVFRGTWQDPFLGKITSLLDKIISTGSKFSFGPISDPSLLVPWQPEDYTNLEIKLEFTSIDFNAMQTAVLVSREHIARALRRKLNEVLTGEVAQSVKVVAIFEEEITITVHKHKDSDVSMVEEMQKLKDLVADWHFDLDLPYIRPVLATRLNAIGTFRDLCPEKYPEFGKVDNLGFTFRTTTTDFNTSDMPTVTELAHGPFILLYNGSLTVPADLRHLMDSSNGDHSCYVDIRTCPLCVDSFSWQTCSFTVTSAPGPPNVFTTTYLQVAASSITPGYNTSTPVDDGIEVGDIVGITVSAMIALAVISAIAVAVYMKKQKVGSPASSSCSSSHTASSEVGSSGGENLPPDPQDMPSVSGEMPMSGASQTSPPSSPIEEPSGPSHLPSLRELDEL